MNEKPVIVVGGGLIGVTTLYELVSRNIPAVLLEGRNGLAEETSFANGGMLTPSMPDPWNGPGVLGHLLSSVFDPHSAMKLRLHAIPGLSIWGLQFLRNASKDRHRAATQANYLLSAYSKYLMDELRGRLDLDYDSSSLGTMKVFPTEEAMGRPIAIAEMLKSLGLRFEILDREETIKVEPQLGNVKEKIAGALRFPDDGSGDAHLFALAIAQQAVAAGGEIRTGVSVRRLLADGARITGVETAEGPIQGSRVILANGVFAPQLALSVGVRLPIKPAKGYSATLDMTGFKEVPKVPIIDDAMHAAVVPLGTRLRFAGTAEFTGYDTQIRQDRVDNLFGLFERLYPDLAVKVDRNQMQGWAGLRPISADGKAFIGESRIEGLWINAGHGHLGWTMAVGSAALLVDLMSCERPRVDVMPFSPRRIS